MYRLVLITALFVLLYYLLRRAVRKFGEESRVVKSGDREEAGKQMVQDPVCRVFVPRENAVRETIGGQTYFFCSAVCASSFEKQLSG